MNVDGVAAVVLAVAAVVDVWFVGPVDASGSGRPGQVQAQHRRMYQGTRIAKKIQILRESDEMITRNRIITNYNREEPPLKDRPTEVSLGIHIISIFSISEQTMDYSMSMYFRQQWRDPRLVFPEIRKKKSSIRLKDGDWNVIWIPDTYFRNEKGAAKFHDVTVNNRMLTVNCTGHVWYVTRITATFSCPMKLQLYPMDTQSCPMQFESFGYTMDTLYFGWLGKPVEVYDNVRMPQFTLVNWLKTDCSDNYTTGAYPCAEIRFVIRRDIGYFFIQVFVPSILVVMLSWVSFWINIDGAPARVSLGLLTVLTTTTQSVSINDQMPRVSYIKAIDIWMIVCLVFVFCGLLEYALVNVAARTGVRTRTLALRNVPMLSVDGVGPMDLSAPQDIFYSTSMLTSCFRSVRDLVTPSTDLSVSTVDVEGSKRLARSIDRVARKIFPLSFLLFNVVYFIVYTVASVTTDE